MASSGSVLHKGCRLSYDVRGEGPPVLLVQGTGVQGAAWRPQVDGLAGRYQCLWFDNRGMGRSQPIGTRLSVEQMAEDAQKVMDTQGWESAHVVGHSLGGLIALHFALSARARVRSLSLLCTFSRGSDVTQLSPLMIWLGLRTRIGTRRQRRNAFLRLVMPDALLAEADQEKLAAELGALFGHDLADHPPVVMKQLAAARAYDATPRLGELAGLATLVVSSRHDRIARLEFGKALAAAIPQSRFVEIPDAGHGVVIQCTERVNTLLLEHLARAERID